MQQDSSASPAALTPSGTGDRSTHFTFAHRLFQVDGACFGIARDTREPVFRVRLGSVTAALPLGTLRIEFGIEPESDDGRLLDILEKSLRYVKEIRPGDAIPRELLDGSASWPVDEHHRTTARARLAVQLASWMAGEEMVISDTVQLEQLAEDPGTKGRMQNAIGELAERIGIGRARRAEVTDKIEDFAREFSYIEALRARAGAARDLLQTLQRFARIYSKERTIAEDIVRIQQLLRPPIAEFETSFRLIDAQTGEILNVLQKFEAQVNFIREMRDDLHFRLRQWDEVLARWAGRPVEQSPEAEALIKETYRFAAHNFPQQQSWRR